MKEQGGLQIERLALESFCHEWLYIWWCHQGVIVGENLGMIFFFVSRLWLFQWMWLITRDFGFNLLKNVLHLDDKFPSLLELANCAYAIDFCCNNCIWAASAKVRYHTFCRNHFFTCGTYASDEFQFCTTYNGFGELIMGGPFVPLACEMQIFVSISTGYETYGKIIR